MKPTIDALRALTVTVFRRIFAPAMWIVVVATITAYLLVIYLGGWVHPAWWLLLLILVPATIILAVIALAARLVSRSLMPRPLKPAEHKQLVDVSDRIIRVAEVRATPAPVLMFLVAKDVLRGKSSSYIASVVDDTTSLQKDWSSIRRLFMP